MRSSVETPDVVDEVYTLDAVYPCVPEKEVHHRSFRWAACFPMGLCFSEKAGEGSLNLTKHALNSRRLQVSHDTQRLPLTRYK